MYESRAEPLLSGEHFLARMARHVAAAAALVIGSLLIGMSGLYAGLVFLVTVGVVFAPVPHRALHKFHWTKDIAR